MNSGDTNSILANLEEVSIHREVEVKVAALLDRLPMMKCSEVTTFSSEPLPQPIYREGRWGDREFLNLRQETRASFINDAHPKKLLKRIVSSEDFDEDDLRRLADWGINFNLEHISLSEVQTSPINIYAKHMARNTIDIPRVRILPFKMDDLTRLTWLADLHATVGTAAPPTWYTFDQQQGRWTITD